LEFALDGVETDDRYPFQINEIQIDARHATTVIDWAPLIHAILTDQQNQVSIGRIAAQFHHTLVEIIVAMAKRWSATQVVLTGGCFQNRYLTERTVKRLRTEGFHPFWHRRVPPNDGGIAVGQIAARRRLPTTE
jgi:hydrogenase maturation protein HypF